MTATAATLIRFAEGMTARQLIDAGEWVLPMLAVAVLCYLLSPTAPPRHLSGSIYR
jgi:hypothetical protein